MASHKTRKIESALSKKGFRIKNGKKCHHKKYTLFVDGKRTRVYTWISHGIKEYNDSLLSEMKKELYLESPKEIEDLICCPMSGEELVILLKERGVLR